MNKEISPSGSEEQSMSDSQPEGEEYPTKQDQLLDRDGSPVAGVGRLDQVVGSAEADRFFKEREERQQFLRKRSLKRRGCAHDA